MVGLKGSQEMKRRRYGDEVDTEKNGVSNKMVG